MEIRFDIINKDAYTYEAQYNMAEKSFDIPNVSADIYSCGLFEFRNRLRGYDGQIFLGIQPHEQLEKHESEAACLYGGRHKASWRQ